MHDFTALARLAYDSGRYPENLNAFRRNYDLRNPKYYIDQVDEAATIAAIELTMRRGDEAGLAPLTGLYNIVWYNRRPCVYALWFFKARIMGHPAYDGREFLFEGEGDQKTCVCRIGRKFPKKDTETEVEVYEGRFSVADAKRADLINLPHYVHHLDWMLETRAFYRAMNDAFPDVLGGLSIAEEQRDVELTPVIADKPVPAPVPDEFTRAAMAARTPETPDYVAAHQAHKNGFEIAADDLAKSESVARLTHDLPHGDHPMNGLANEAPLITPRQAQKAIRRAQRLDRNRKRHNRKETS